MIFPAIQSILFVSCQMATMAVRHPSLFSTDLMIPIVKVPRLVSGDITVSEFSVNPSILVI
jgi:hypothetical protein